MVLCMYVCMYVCIFVFYYLHIPQHSHVCTHRCVHVYIYTYIYIRQISEQRTRRHKNPYMVCPPKKNPAPLNHKARKSSQTALKQLTSTIRDTPRQNPADGFRFLFRAQRTQRPEGFVGSEGMCVYKYDMCKDGT